MHSTSCKPVAGGRMRVVGRRGMTLLEAVVSVAVVALVLGLAVPRYVGYLTRRQLQNAAFLVQGDLRLAQQTAIAQSGDGPRVEVCLRPDGYDIYRVAFRSPADRDPTDVVSGATVKVANVGGEYRDGIAVVLLPGGAPCLIAPNDESRVALGFSGSGALYPGGGVRRSVRLTLHGQALFVDVEPGTGLATVRPWGASRRASGAASQTSRR